jgi:hypothetical protein
VEEVLCVLISEEMAKGQREVMGMGRYILETKLKSKNLKYLCSS